MMASEECCKCNQSDQGEPDQRENSHSHPSVYMLVSFPTLLLMVEILQLLIDISIPQIRLVWSFCTSKVVSQIGPFPVHLEQDARHTGGGLMITLGLLV